MITLANGLPKGQKSPVLSEADIQAARLNNQFLIQGTNPEFPVAATEKGVIAFLEYVAVTTAGTFTVEDKAGNILTGAIVDQLDLSHAPLRMDGGVRLNGAILIAKGFYIKRENLEG
jgi:hypothetical protein